MMDATEHEFDDVDVLAQRVAAAGDMESFRASGAFDELMEHIDSGQLQIDGKDGFLNRMIKAVLERGLQAERVCPRSNWHSDQPNIRQQEFFC